MKPMQLIQSIFILLIILNPVMYGQTVEKSDPDQTLSPFFFVKSDDPDLDQLPLKMTHADVNISGVIADVRVVQVYKNEGKSVLEALYIFPASTRAAVYDMKMTIGERVIQAKIKERKNARQEYEQAVREGRTASLLEQQRPNVFQMNVGNILPGDEIKVELSYTELLTAEEKIYTFVYPTVVGPRYTNQSGAESRADQWIKNPYLQEGEDPTYGFDIDVDISAGLPIQEIFSPSHDININYKGVDEALIALSNGGSKTGNRDFILKYRLAGNEISPGLLLYKGVEENFFLMMLQPPNRIRTNEIPSREYIFIVDVSGSMNGFPLDISKQLLRNLIGNLRQGDRFNVLLFAAGSSIMTEKSLPATQENINRAIQLIERERGGGGTELLPALKRALSLPREEGISRTVVIATDGYVSVEKESFDLIRHNLGKANIFPFGIGSSVNRFLIEGMARAGMGEPFVITRKEDANEMANKFREYISSPVLTQIRYDIEGFNVYDVEPVTIPDVFSERPVLLFGKWRGNLEGEITIKGNIAQDKNYLKTIHVSDYDAAGKNSALKYLWARHRIAMLADYNQISPNDERVQDILNLGLTYNLLTDYTSFIATDTQIRNQGGTVTTVQQPLPLPYGVSDLAVAGGSVGIMQRTGYNKSGNYPVAPLKEVREISRKEDEKKPGGLNIRIEFQSEKFEKFTKNLEKQVQAYNNEFEYCFLKFKKTGISGLVKFRVKLDKQNKIVEVKMVKDQLKNKNLADCLSKKIGDLKLNSPDKTSNLIFIVELNFAN